MNLPALGNDGLFNKILICYMYVGTFAEIVGSSVTIKLSAKRGIFTPRGRWNRCRCTYVLYKGLCPVILPLIVLWVFCKCLYFGRLVSYKQGEQACFKISRFFLPFQQSKLWIVFFHWVSAILTAVLQAITVPLACFPCYLQHLL